MKVWSWFRSRPGPDQLLMAMGLCLWLFIMTALGVDIVHSYITNPLCRF